MTGGRSLEIVIVSYRCRDLLVACLRSIGEHPYTRGPLSVTVVDNASEDGTFEAVRDGFAAVHFVELEDNVGFSSANNLALHRSTAEQILLLNPDTEVWEGVLDTMSDFLDAHPRAGVAGCRLVRRDGSFDHAAKRSIPSVADAVRYFRPGGGPGSDSGYLAPQVGEHEIGPVDAVNGAFMLVRRTAMVEVGLLDAGYWMYGEDLDWCTRFRRAGWEVLYNGEVTTLHVKGATAGTHRRWRQNMAFHQSMGRFYRRHLGGERVLLPGAIAAESLLDLCPAAAAFNCLDRVVDRLVDTREQTRQLRQQDVCNGHGSVRCRERAGGDGLPFLFAACTILRDDRLVVERVDRAEAATLRRGRQVLQRLRRLLVVAQQHVQANLDEVRMREVVLDCVQA